MKFLIADPVDEKALTALKELGEVEYIPDITPEQLIEKIPDFGALVVRSRTKVTKEVIDAGKNLKIIARAGVGTDNIDTEYAKSKNVEIVNTPGAPSISVAELTIALMFSLSRKIPQADSTMREKKWIKKELMGHEFSEKTLGIIGFGRIGSKVAKFARALDMKVIVYDPGAKDERLQEVNAEKVELETLLKQSDVITLHVPLTDETKDMIGENEFSIMKDTAYLINTSRGHIVDEKTLCKALKEGKLGGAAFDVYWEKTPFDSELMECPNTVMVPHLGSTTFEAQNRIGELLVEKLKQAIAKF